MPFLAINSCASLNQSAISWAGLRFAPSSACLALFVASTVFLLASVSLPSATANFCRSGTMPLNFSSVRSILPFRLAVEISPIFISTPASDKRFCTFILTNPKLALAPTSSDLATFNLSCASAASFSKRLCSLVLSPTKSQIPCCFPSSSSMALIFSETVCIWSMGRLPALSNSCNWLRSPCKYCLVCPCKSENMPFQSIEFCNPSFLAVSISLSRCISRVAFSPTDEALRIFSSYSCVMASFFSSNEPYSFR